jgi:hypothetical protein
VSILKQLAKLTERSFVGHAAGEFLLDQLQAGNANRPDPDILADLLMIARGALSEEAVLNLALQTAQDPRCEAYDIGPALDVILEFSGPAEVQSILQRRVGLSIGQASSDPTAFYHLVHRHRLEASYGGRANAAKALFELSTRNGIPFGKKVYVCEVLAQMGCTSNARRRLRKLSGHAASTEDRLVVAKAAMRFHDWMLARQIFPITARDQSAAPNTAFRPRAGSGRRG